MEKEILNTLDFHLGRPLSLHFLRRNSKAGDVSAEHHNFAKFAMEAALTEYSLAHIMPSKMAAAALLLGLRIIDGGLF
jgi:Cyclin, C-terminal domain